jgi:hypothetical protein
MLGRRFAVFCFAVVFGTASLAQAQALPANRFIGLASPRCEFEDVDLEECSQERSKLLENGSITQEEHDFLKHVRSIPVFDLRDRLVGYCHCG